MISLRPTKIFIEIGINDIIEKVSLEEIVRNYEAIVQQLLEECPGIRIFIQSNLPVCIKGSILTSKADINALIDEQNERLKELATRYQLTYVDLHGHFQKNGELDMGLTTDESVLMMKAMRYGRKWLNRTCNRSFHVGATLA